MPLHNPERITNALTVDVEDYFQVNAFADRIDPATWDSFPLRVGDSTRRVLDLFEERGVQGTFFVLGWVAERLPDLVREIHRRGHEVACHGYDHQLVFRMTPDEFRSDVRRAKSILEDITGEPVIGFRAPSWSIVERTLWALDVLIEEGFGYDSSIFPVRHDVYGMPDAPRFLHTVSRPAGEIAEFPPSTVRVGVGPFRTNLPVAGGGYLRLYPTWFTARTIRRLNEVEGQPAVVYFHPWELDPGQPRMAAGWRSRFRHYVNLRRTALKLGRLLEDPSFGPMRDLPGLEELPPPERNPRK